MTTEPSIALLSNFRTACVVVVGDVMLDRFIYGDVKRISPEAPVPILRVQREAVMAGGAGNVANNIAALGGTTALIGVVGDDAAAAEVGALLRANSRIGEHLVIERGRQTTVKVRYVAQSQQLIRADREDTDPVSDATRARVIDDFERSCTSCNVVLLSDYGKGVLSAGLAADLVAAARRRGLSVIVDPKGNDYHCYAGADIITPNHHELAVASGMPTESDDEVVAAGKAILEKFGVKAVLATRGARGMALIWQGHSPLLLPAQAREVFDVSGAGDTALATLAVALSSGIALTDAVFLSNAAAGIVVGKLGTATCSTDELAAALTALTNATAESKIVDDRQLIVRIAQWRQSGQRIGFTNGCFDLLHPGHISLLRQARAECDRLIVALNSDQSVRRLKGSDRPVNSQMSRATVLASLTDVDAVTIFDEDTPLSLIQSVRPDILVKGADYGMDEVVGGDFVRSYGGRVLLARLSAGFSTTDILRRVAANTETLRASEAG